MYGPSRTLFTTWPPRKTDTSACFTTLDGSSATNSVPASSPFDSASVLYLFSGSPLLPFPPAAIIQPTDPRYTSSCHSPFLTHNIPRQSAVGLSRKIYHRRARALPRSQLTKLVEKVRASEREEHTSHSGSTAQKRLVRAKCLFKNAHEASTGPRGKSIYTGAFVDFYRERRCAAAESLFGS